MKRKDCDRSAELLAFGERHTSSQLRRITTLAVLLVAPASAHAGSIRMFSSAVVVEPSIHLSDIAELQGFEPQEEQSLSQVVVASAPSAGGTRLLDLERLRSAVAEAGHNLARITVGGSIQCTVSRPAELAPSAVSHHSDSDLPRTRMRSVRDPAPGTARSVRGEGETEDAPTLRRAVVDHFRQALARMGARAEVVFDHTSESVLDLAGPAYSFRIRPRRSELIGLIPVEVDVLTDGLVAQQVPLVVQVSAIRRAVAAKRSINQDAAIRAADVELAEVAVTRLDEPLLDSLNHVVGQRARRFLPAGTLLTDSMIEAVPLVTRGQLVTLISVAGRVRVVTTAKAVEDGLLGQVIKVRAVDNQRMEFDATVAGPGEVQIGNGSPPPPLAVAAATGGQP